ncbi:MAG TPA: cyanophycinase [Pyrinomonadaceae bacterium]|jgi:cyanophycinase
MSKPKSTLFAIGGGEIADAPDILDEFLVLLKDKPDAHIVVMTVSTNEPKEVGRKYSAMFRNRGVKHVSVVDVSDRIDSFSEAAGKKIASSDALFFSGGDQLHVTSLMGGSPLNRIIYEKVEKGGFIIAGTSAGAMMMSDSMIISGRNDIAPKSGGVEIAPGMNLLKGTIIDTHFSQRGRHGRLMMALAHFPQLLGIGLDERTAICQSNGEFKVIGEGVATIMDAREMKHSNLIHLRDGEPLGMFGITVHTLPAGYSFDLKKREPISPVQTKFASANNEE